MATPLFAPNESTSSKPSSPQEPGEHTSLLGSHRENSATSATAVLSASQPHGQDAPRPVDDEAAGASGSVRGKAEPKLATGIVGLISVLLLGAYSTSVLFPSCTMSC